MAPVQTLLEWLALPEVPIPEATSTVDKGHRHRVLKVGAFWARQAECRAAGLGNLPIEQADRVALPTATLDTKSGPVLHRLPWQLGGWAVDIVGLAHVAGVRFLPADVEVDGRYTAGTGRGDEYDIRSWAKAQN